MKVVYKGMVLPGILFNSMTNCHMTVLKVYWVKNRTGIMNERKKVYWVKNRTGIMNERKKKRKKQKKKKACNTTST